MRPVSARSGTGHGGHAAVHGCATVSAQSVSDEADNCASSSCDVGKGNSPHGGVNRKLCVHWASVVRALGRARSKPAAASVMGYSDGMCPVIETGLDPSSALP